MTDRNDETPQSPEVHETDVREELAQDQVSHLGEHRTPGGDAWHQKSRHSSHHLGAVDDETTLVVPPMSGPADLIGEDDADGQGNESGNTEIGDELFDPRDELTPG